MNKTGFENNKRNHNTFVISLLPLNEYFIHYYFSRLFIITLCLLSVFMLGITTNAISAEREETVSSSSNRQLSVSDYLKKYHNDAPVDILGTLYYAVNDETRILSENKLPFFTTTEYKTKDNTQHESACHPVKPSSEKLNGVFSFDRVLNLIDQKKIVPITEWGLFDYLLKYYGSLHYVNNDQDIKTLTITVKGMLFNLQQRAEQGDSVAITISAFLENPWFTQEDLIPKKNNQWFSFLSWDNLKKMFSMQKRKPTISERLTMLPDFAKIDQKTRSQRLYSLCGRGFEYKRNHIFTTYESDDKRTVTSYSSDNLAHNYEEMQQMITDHGSTVPSTDNGIKSVAKILLTGCILSAVMRSAYGLTVPAPQCGSDGNCYPDSYIPLFQHNFTQDLTGDAKGHYKLVEDIRLSDEHPLPLYKNCRTPFSGIIATGNHTLSAYSSAYPLFGCVKNANFSGNIDPCRIISTMPVLADKVADGNTFNIQQADWCYNQRPLVNDLAGDNNHLTLTSVPDETICQGEIASVARGAGIIANTVSGDENAVTIQNGCQPLDAPVVNKVSGNKNTFYHNNMASVVNMDSYYPNLRKITAHNITGKDNLIKNHRVNCTLVLPDPKNQSQDVIEIANPGTQMLSSDTVINIKDKRSVSQTAALRNHNTEISSGCPKPEVISDHSVDFCKMRCYEWDDTVLTSGEIRQNTRCPLPRCPVTSLDSAGVILSDELAAQCKDASIDTRKDIFSDPDNSYLVPWIKYCDSKNPDNTPRSKFFCYLPNEQILGVAANNQVTQAWLTSRRTYPFNPEANTKGVIRITNLRHPPYLGSFEIFNACDEDLVTALPVNQVVTKQYLLGLYPGREKGQSVQLFSSIPDQGQLGYRAQSFPVEGEALLMTNSSVLINNQNNATLDLYKLTMPTSNDSLTLSLDAKPYEVIALPSDSENIIAAAIKDDLIYIGVTSNTDAQQVDVIRYNTTTKVWDYNLQQVRVKNTDMNYQMYVDDKEHIHFLRNKDVVSDPQKPEILTFRIPQEGGYFQAKTQEPINNNEKTE